ncbi:hypothetical protein ATER59S_01564 [Aquamicrobium terrae]
MRHPEPAFSHGGPTWPLAGLGAMPAERDDPALAIPRGAVQLTARDIALRSHMAQIGPVPAVPAVAAPMGNAGKRAERKRRWMPAIVISCLLHAAAAAALLASPFGTIEDPVQIEGGEQSGILMAGTAAEDSTSAGAIADTDVTQVTLVPMVDAKPVQTVDAEQVQTVEAEPVQTAEVQPVTVAEAAEPVSEADAVAPATETMQSVETETQPAAAVQDEAQPAVEAPLPQILAAAPLSPPQDDIVQPAAEAPAQAQAEDIVAAEEMPQQKPRAKQTPPAKPKPQEKPARKAKPGKKPEPRPRKARTQAGSGGQAESDARRGVSDGRDDGDTTLASRGARSSAAGNAAVSNYPGKVAAKLRRVARNISPSARAKARNNAQVAFVVNGGGGIGALRLVKSSGSPELDKAALAIVERAAPFPPIPPEAGRPNWAFTLPIGPF